MSEQSVDILVIGNGVSAKALLWEIEGRKTSEKVLQVSSEKLYPMTSLKTTAIVAFHGMRKGVSPLGDVLCDGVDNFFKNVYGTGLMGMEKGEFFDLAHPKDEEKLRSRYKNVLRAEKDSLTFKEVIEGSLYSKEDCIFIKPSIFLSSLDEQFNCPLKSKTLLSIKDKKAYFLGGDTISFNKIVLSSGQGLCHLKGLGLDFEKNIVEVPGAYLEWEVDLNCPSFAYGVGGANLVYRNSDKCLMLGGSTQKNALISPDHVALEEFYNKAQGFGLTWIPSFDSGKIQVGIRVKGPKRLPLFEEVEKDIYILGAAYKNGWSQAFWGAKKIAQKLF